MPRSLEYYVLRVCERLHFSEQYFLSLTYPEQLRWLAYDCLRRQEEAAWNIASE